GVEIGDDEIPDDEGDEAVVRAREPDEQDGGPFPDGVEIYRGAGVAAIASAIQLTVFGGGDGGEGLETLHQIDAVEQEHDPGDANVDESVAFAAMRCQPPGGCF